MIKCITFNGGGSREGLVPTSWVRKFVLFENEMVHFLSIYIIEQHVYQPSLVRPFFILLWRGCRKEVVPIPGKNLFLQFVTTMLHFES